MAEIKARLTVLKTDQFITDDDGHPARVTPEILRKLAEESGLAVEPIPGVVGGLQAMVEIIISTPSIPRGTYV